MRKKSENRPTGDFQHDSLSKKHDGIKRRICLQKMYHHTRKMISKLKMQDKVKTLVEFKRINTLAQKANISNQGNS